LSSSIACSAAKFDVTEHVEHGAQWYKIGVVMVPSFGKICKNCARAGPSRRTAQGLHYSAWRRGKTWRQNAPQKIANNQ
jgi:hypothetical protein